MDAVRVDGLTRRFRASGRGARATWFAALDDVSFAVPPGTVCAILGQNGAGKTTLFEILSTLLLPHGGCAMVDGHDVVREPSAVRRRIAYAPAGGTGFFPRLTGRQNLEYFAALYDVGPREWRARAHAAAASVAIDDALDRRVDQYSDGMRQRLALARAQLTQARVWILDEPTRGLDPGSRAHTQDLLLRTARERGVTILLSTHDLDEAARIGDHLIVLHRGRVTLDQPVEALRHRPAALADAYGAATQEAQP